MKIYEKKENSLKVFGAWTSSADSGYQKFYPASDYLEGYAPLMEAGYVSNGSAYKWAGSDDAGILNKIKALWRFYQADYSTVKANKVTLVNLDIDGQNAVKSDPSSFIYHKMKLRLNR
jgi:hypothetical protein